ncbi:MAG: type II toxin-antitoxin system HicB family antitoxin [Candidatus Geothermincolia bacterium]
MHRFLVIVEKTPDSYSVYAPDLPGCIATGASREEAELNMSKAVEIHIRGLLERGLPIPEPRSIAEYVAFQVDSNS